MTVLLLIIYLSFISLGLPDSLVGAAWPAIHTQLGAPLAGAGLISALVFAGTVLSSLLCARLLHRLGTGLLTALSTGLTALALLGMGFAGSYWVLCALALPLGFGAGAVDAALNNFVALHFKARHMNWLHCFWGLGATAGPIILSLHLANPGGWKTGFHTVGALQAAMAVTLLFSLPRWRVKSADAQGQDAQPQHYTALELLRTRGIKPQLTAYFCYCAAEMSTAIWGASYLILQRGVAIDTAARWVALFYFGITFGRMLCGFLSMRIPNKSMVRIGTAVLLFGVVAILLPLGKALLPAGLCCIGLGCAPIYPGMLHRTPELFGKERSSSLMGLQMATANLGAALMPPLFGLLAQYVSIELYPFYIGLIALVMFGAYEAVNRFGRNNEYCPAD